MAFKILCVEAPASHIALIRQALMPIVHQLITTEDTQQCLALALQESPKLILIDVDLANDRGLNVIHELKQSAALKHIPIVALSTDDGAPMRQKCIELGCIEVLYKPLERSHLLEIIAYLQEDETRPTLPQSNPLKTVLIVHHNPDARFAFARAFDHRYFAVHLAADSQDAIDHLQIVLPDVLLIDVNMPRLSGFDVLRYVKKQQHIKQIQVVLIKGSFMAIQESNTEQAKLLLIKPFNPDNLRQLAQQLAQANI